LDEGTILRLTIGLGAVTVMPGSGVAPSAGACESWASVALPNAHSRSDAELEASHARFNENDIVLILPKLNPLTDCGLPSMSDGPISIDPRKTGHVDAAIRKIIKPSMSGSGRRARLEGDAAVVQMDEFGVSGQEQKFDCLRQQQYWWRCEQRRIGQRHDGADHAGLSGLPIGIVIGGSLLACLLERGRGLRGNSMEVSERHHKLDRQRQ
jgi:hypothetical protein